MKRKFTFELLIVNNAQLSLARYSSSPKIDSVVNNCIPSLTKQVRVSAKAFFQVYISRHLKPIQMKVEEMLSIEVTSGNPLFLLNVTQDVLKRLNDKLPNSKDEIGNPKRAIVNNIKHLLVSMRAHGRLDREQNSPVKNIALAVWDDVSLAVLESHTGLSKRMIKHGRDVRLKINADVEKENREQAPTSIYVTPTQHNDSDGSASDSENDSSEDEEDMSRKRRRSGEEDDGR